MSMHEELRNIRADIIQLKEEMARLNEERARFDDRITSLQMEANGYLRIRRRFFDAYQRTIQCHPQFQHTAIIHEENRIAHAGDARGDARLFINDNRKDFALFKALYGWSPHTVIQWQEEPENADIFFILDAFASLAANYHLSDSIKSSFLMLAYRLEDDWGETPSLAAPGTPLRQAWDHFVRAYRSECRLLHPPPWLLETRI